LINGLLNIAIYFMEEIAEENTSFNY